MTDTHQSRKRSKSKRKRRKVGREEWYVGNELSLTVLECCAAVSCDGYTIHTVHTLLLPS